MPTRLLPPGRRSGRSCSPLAAGAAAADYVPGEVIVGYEDGGAASAGVETLRSTRRAVRAGSSSRAATVGHETVASCARTPTWPTPCPTTWRTRRSSLPQRPGLPAASGTSSAPFGIGMPEAWELAARGRRARRPRRGRGGARQRRRLRAPRRATGARPTCAATFVTRYDFVDRDRHPNDDTATAPTWPARSPRPPTTASAWPGIAYGAKIMPLRVLDAYGEGDSVAIARGDPLRGQRTAPT